MAGTAPRRQNKGIFQGVMARHIPLTTDAEKGDPEQSCRERSGLPNQAAP